MAEPNRPTCIVADDHALIREALTMQLEDWGAVDVVAHAANWHAAVQLICEMRPDLALVDLRMPGGSGMDLIEAVTACGCPTRVVLVTACHDASMVRGARAKGAAGFIPKALPFAQFTSALDRVLLGEPFVDGASVEPDHARAAAVSGRAV